MVRYPFQVFCASTFALTLGLTIAGPVSAQVVPDRTLPVNSSVTAGCVVCEINAGTTRGTNLFHSFSSFSVPTNGSAYFNNAPQIRTIFTRVTGSQISNIDGLLRSNGSASLFLMNPNGIVFGPNASLNLGGSFLGTTANAIGFGQRETFSASNPDAPPLLTINPSALIFNSGNRGRIVNRSVTDLGMTAPDGIDLYGLQVKTGKGFALIGGDVRMVGGGINAPGGRVELGGIVAPGTIAVSPGLDGFQFQFPSGVDRSNVVLSDESLINVASEGGGTVLINARDVEISDNSSIRGGLETGAIGDRPAGELKVNATGQLRMNQSSSIKSLLNPRSSGTGGNILIQADSLDMSSGAQIANINALAQGITGNIAINIANIVRLDGTDQAEVLPTGITSSAALTIGNSGKIDITAGSIFVTRGANLSSSSVITLGNAGEITLNARDRVVFDGVSNSGALRSGATSQSLLGIGNSGKIRINTGSLSILNGGQLNSSKLSVLGDSGDIEINARDSVLVSGISASGLPSFITTSLGESSIGKAGNIEIKTGSMSVTNGAALVLQTAGNGDGGNVSIDARNQVFIGNGKDEKSTRTFITTSVGEGGIGNGGTIAIRGDSILIQNGGVLGSLSIGQGNGGNIILNANSTVQLDNGSLLSSSFFKGDSGDISISANRDILLTGGTLLYTSAFGQGSAGRIDLSSKNTITLDEGSSISSGFFSLKNLTDFIEANGFSTQDLPASFFNLVIGNANDIKLTARSLRLDRGSFIATTTTFGNGGNVDLQIDDLLLLRQGSSISTSAGSLLPGFEQGGDGGNINVNIPNGFVVAVASENSDISANAFSGRGGRVNVTTQGLYGIQFRPRVTPLSDITASSTFGVSGIVTLNSLGLDPSNSLVQLPVGLVDPTNKIDRRCSPKAPQRSSSFTITGTGGIPASPIEALQQQNALVNLVPLPKEDQTIEQSVQSPMSASSHAIAEAQGWSIDDTGGIWLVASDERSQRSPIASPNCSGNALMLGDQS
jgi:filamentous hemagglutinin family protein